jgi:phosphoenolpyruvate carboxylase
VEAGVPRDTVDTFFQDALISPVLTAHPTEVQRKSILDAARHRPPAGRARPASDAEGTRRQPAPAARARATLWQTRMLRYSS